MVYFLYGSEDMRFIKNVSEKEYRKFWENVPNSHFMQSYEWGQACKKNRNQTPCYVGLMDDDGNYLAVALLLKRIHLLECVITMYLGDLLWIIVIMKY